MKHSNADHQFVHAETRLQGASAGKRGDTGAMRPAALR
jgi:hypothetical protein